MNGYTEIAKLRAEQLAAAPKEFGPGERDEFLAIQKRADAVLREFGRTAADSLAPRNLESAFEYRLRVAQALAKETKLYRSKDISTIPQGRVFDQLEQEIYDSARAQAAHPLDLKRGQVREIIKNDSAGREIVEFVCGAGGGSFKTVFGAWQAPAFTSPIYDKAGQPCVISTVIGGH